MGYDVLVLDFGQAADAFLKALRALGDAQRVLIVGDEERRAYARPPLSKAHLLSRPPPLAYSVKEGGLLRSRGRLGVTAIGLDAARRTVSLSNGGTVAYGTLVLATGGSTAADVSAQTLADPTDRLRRL